MRNLFFCVWCMLLTACAPLSGTFGGSSISTQHAITASPDLTPALALSLHGKAHEIILLDGKFQPYKTIQWKFGPSGGGSPVFDKAANIYLSDSGSPNAVGNLVLIFSPPYKTPPTKISVGSDHVVAGIAVDEKTGVFAAVANPAYQNASTQVRFFRAGATRSCASVTFPTNTILDLGDAFDGEGNLFITQFVGGGYLQMMSIAGECRPQSPVVYTPNLPDTISGFLFNASDQLLINYYRPDSVIWTFAHPENGSLGQGLKSTTLGQADGREVYMTALSSDGRSIFAAPYFKPNIYLYHYPAGGAPFGKILTPEDPSTAVNPPIVP